MKTLIQKAQDDLKANLMDEHILKLYLEMAFVKGEKEQLGKIDYGSCTSVTPQFRTNT